MVVGPEPALNELGEASCRRDRDPEVVVAGGGIVGSTIAEELSRASIATTVVDVEAAEDPDVVGDATDGAILDRAGIEESSVFVVGLPDDDAAVLAVLLADDLGAGIDVVARSNDRNNETKLRRAGADYVLGMGTISGRILARDLLDEELLFHDRQLRLVRMDATRFAGTALGDADVPSTCAIVAVERDETVITELSSTFKFLPGDRAIVAGSDEDVAEIGGRSMPCWRPNGIGATCHNTVVNRRSSCRSLASWERNPDFGATTIQLGGSYEPQDL